jgi:hypothetical protein
MNEGELIRGREAARAASASGRRGGRRGGDRAWRHAGAWARGAGGSLLEEGEGEGAGVGLAGREAEAQEEWGWLGRSGRLSQKGGPGRFGSSAKTKK